MTSKLFLANGLWGRTNLPCCGAYHAFDFGKYAGRYLAAIAYRFNRRFQLKTLPERLLVAAATIGPRPEGLAADGGGFLLIK